MQVGETSKQLKSSKKSFQHCHLSGRGFGQAMLSTLSKLSITLAGFRLPTFGSSTVIMITFKIHRDYDHL